MIGKNVRRGLGALLVCLQGLVSPLPAAIVPTGNVEPNVFAWSDNTTGYIGRNSDGHVLVDSGSVLSSRNVYLGANFPATGSATITGAGSRWANDDSLYVGNLGNGTLTVTDGGSVVTAELSASLSNLFGNGTVRATDGAVLDAELLFNATTGTQASIAFGSGGILTVGANGGRLGAGYKDVGSLTVADAVVIESSLGYLGLHARSAGTATVSGLGAHWINRFTLYVGDAGSGALTIEAGGKVSSPVSHLGDDALSIGVATVTGTGSQWTNTGSIRVGNAGDGAFTVKSGGEVSNTAGYLGYDSAASGTVVVSDPGSQWRNSSSLYVGNSGSGALTIAAGGYVSNANGYLGYNPGASGTARVTGTDSHWRTRNSLYVGHSGSGTFTIEDGGELWNDAEVHIAYNSAASGTAKVTGDGSQWTNWSWLSVGEAGSGTLTIENGGQLKQWSNRGAVIAEFPGSTGVAIVKDLGSKWTNHGPLEIAYSGKGALNIEAGAQVSSTSGYLGMSSNGYGVVMVTGAGSTWTSGFEIAVGYHGNGTLDLRDGGSVSTFSASVNNKSLMSIDVTGGSKLTLADGSGTITNNGRIRILASAAATTGTQHSPIAAGTWLGTGTYQALGGTWDAANHVFTVSDVALGASGVPLELDASQQQRALIDDAQQGWTVGASLLAQLSAPAPLTVTAAALPGPELAGLGPNVLGAWDFAVSGAGYATGDPLYLSFGVDPALSRSDLSLWHFDGASWSAFPAEDLTTSGGFASFTVAALGSYALTAVAAPGDFDSDGDVDGADFLDWQLVPNLGSLADWRANFETGAPLSPNSIAVPEPLTGVLVLCLAPLALRTLRTRGRVACPRRSADVGMDCWRTLRISMSTRTRTCHAITGAWGVNLTWR